VRRPACRAAQCTMAGRRECVTSGASAQIRKGPLLPAALFRKEKVIRRANVDLSTTNWPDTRVADRLAKKSEEVFGWATRRAGRVLQSVKRQREYQGYRASASEPAGSSNSMPTLIGAAMIAAAILLSTLINAIGSRYVGFESPTEESAWLVDRLTGQVYKCHAPHPGRASCEAEIATGSVGDRQKRKADPGP
jgi:hypothetical protein